MMIELKAVSTGYPKQTVIEKLSLRFRRGEFCSILGPNGAGKSTLLKAIIGFLPLSSGDILVEGTSLRSLQRRKLAKSIALIPQEIVYQFDYRVTELVLMGRYPYLNYWQTYTRADYYEVEKVLAATHLLELRDKPYSQLSGGEKQRVNIARALVQNTSAILLDESLVHLDLNHQIEIMQFLSKINREQNKLIILISHNINLSSDYCERILMLKDGKLEADGRPETVLTESNVNRIYDTNLHLFENPYTQKPNILYPGIRH